MVPTSCRTSHNYQSSGQAVDPKNTSRAFQVSEFQVPDAAQIGGTVGLNNGSNQGYSNSYVTMNVDAPIFSNNFLDSADNFTSVSSLQNNVLHSQNLNSFTQADARHMIAASGMLRGNAFGDGMQSVSTRENSCYQTNPTYMAGSQQQYLGRQSTQSYENTSRNMGTVMDGKNLQHFISSATLGNRTFNNLMEFSDSNNHSLHNLASVDTGGLYNSNLYSNCLQGTSQIHSMQGPAYFGYLPTQQDGYATSGGSGLAAPISLCQKTSVFSLPGTFHDVDAATDARFSKKVTEGHNAQDLDTLIQPKQNQKQHIGLDTSGFPNMPLNLQLLQNTQGMAFSPRLCQHEQHLPVFGNGVSDCLSGSLDLQQNQSLTYSNDIQEPKLCGQERFSLPESNQQKHMKDSLAQNNQMFCENLYALQNGNSFQPQNTHSLSTSGTKPCHSNPKYNEQSPRISFQGPQESQSIESSLTHYASNSLHDQQSKDNGMQEIVANDIVGPQCSVLADASVDQGTATVIQTRSSGTSVDAMKDCQTDVRRKLYENSISFLVLLYHVTFCKAAGRECPEYKAKCSSVRKLGEHILSCKIKPCSRVQGCQQLTNLVKHHIQCRDHTCRICGTVNRIISKEKNVAVSGSSLNKQSKTMGMHLESSVAVPESIKSESSQQVIGSEKKSVIHSKAEVQMSTPGRTDSPGMQLDIKRQRLDSITSNNSSSVLENNNTNSGVENLSSSMESSTLENEDLEVPFPKRVKTELVDYQREFRTEASLVKSSSISVNKNPSDPATVKNKKVIEHSKIPFQASVASDDGVCHNSIEGNEQSDISSNKDVSGKFTEKEKDSLVKEKISKNMACHKSSSSSKTGKPKIQGVSLTEIFTLEQIQEHLQSLQQWVGQRKRNAEKLQAMRVNKSLNSCSLCAVERLSFEPPLIYCSACANCIKRSSQFYATGSGDARINICRICYNAIKGDSIKIDGIIIQKCNMEKRKNDEEAEEAWVQCDHCQSWQHQICALFNSRMNECGQAEYSCPSCYGEQVRNGERLPLPENAILGAKDLPKTVLSDYIEERLFRKLKLEREERANASSKSYNEVPGVDDLVVRVVSSVDKKVEVKTHFLEIFRNAGYPTEYPYRSKAILLFQKIEGVEVCLFSMYVQEYGTDAPYPNQRHVYLAYLDSVKYFRPDIKTVCGEALRTFVYHEILIGYLEFCKKRGFASCYIWACPPLKGEDYILYCHPEIQKTPRTDKLREWYHTMIRKASKEKIVADMTNLYDFFFSQENENKAKVTAARLPYFDGDYWPGAAEDILNKIPQANDKTNQHKIKKDVTKRALKNFSLSEPSNSNSMDSLLMDKLGDIIKPTKGDFILAHLQPTCAHCRLFIMSGSQWVCGQCRKFQLCDKCYDAELKLDDKSRHPTNSREKHMLSQHVVVDTAMDTRDLDELLESEIFDTRQAFLSLCQGNHYQYDTLRRAKHSSMMILYHLHNPTAPAFVITCIICNQEVDTGKGWRCEICPDFDMCNACYQKNGNSKHPHKLSAHHSGSGQDASTREIRKKKSILIRKNLEVLIHASRCTQCKHPICKKIKAMFRHGSICKVRGQGGCVICKWMWTLLQMHARSCKDSQCRVPRCTDLKDHFQRLQFQSESRRRAAYNEKMRQRALEITEQN